jgi:hypothetical protein
VFEEMTDSLSIFRKAVADATYEVTEDGRVFSMSGWRGYARRELCQHPNDDGYASVRLTINGRRWHVPVHRLVAAEYLSPRPHPSFEIRHLDGNKMNAAATNLKWGTRAANAHDRKMHGNDKAAENGRKSASKHSGERSPWAKLTATDVIAVRTALANGERLVSIAKRYQQVTFATLWRMATGRTWKYV